MTLDVSPGFNLEKIAQNIEARWQRDMAAAHEAWINSPEYKLCEQKAAEELIQSANAENPQPVETGEKSAKP